ncbi:MAG: CocE/NonD family hydrolase [Pseudomonadota bacterium]
MNTQLFGFVVIITLILYLLTSSAVAFDWEREKPTSGDAFTPPTPLYDVRIEHSHFVRMRDGVRLSTDVYFPVGSDGPLPTVYIATPYGKQEWNTPTRLGLMFAEQGYAVVVQDLRGKFESEGQFIVEHNIGPDLDDTADWIAKQEWSNGNVGMFGCSYRGQIQYYVAQERNPHLKAFIADGGGGGGGEVRWGGMNGPRKGGALLLGDGFPWLRDMMETVSVRPSRKLDKSEFVALSKATNHFSIDPPATDYAKAYWHLPLKTMMDATNALPTDWEDYFGRPIVDSYFRRMDITGPKDRVITPTLHMNSWFDFSVTGTLYFADLFERIAINKDIRDHQFKLLTPSSHCGAEKLTKDSSIGDLPLGDPRLDYPRFYLKWFDRWLRGNEKALEGLSSNTYFTTGINQWRTSDVWPPKGIKKQRFLLAGEGSTNTRYGTGKLVTSGTDAASHRNTFLYDPAVPVMSGDVTMSFTSGPNARLQAARELRSDVLVYTSEMLEEPLEVTGRISVDLFVSSSAPDTDYTAWLVDVAPDGKVYDLQTGIIRARYRDDWGKEVMMEPGEVYKVTIDLNALSHVFLPGHKIRLAVSSSNFPKFDRNLNTGGDNFTESKGLIATNAVHHGGIYPSALILPVHKQ